MGPVLRRLIKLCLAVIFFMFLILGAHWASSMCGLIISVSQIGENFGHYYFLKYFQSYPFSSVGLYAFSPLEMVPELTDALRFLSAFSVPFRMVPIVMSPS